MNRSEISTELKSRGINRGLTSLKIDVLRDLLRLLQEGDVIAPPRPSKAAVARSDVFGRIGPNGTFRIVDKRRNPAARGKMPQRMTVTELREVLSFLGWDVPELNSKDQLGTLAVARLKAQGLTVGSTSSPASAASPARGASLSPTGGTFGLRQNGAALRLRF